MERLQRDLVFILRRTLTVNVLIYFTATVIFYFCRFLFFYFYFCVVFFSDLVRNPSALNRDEVNEINKLDNMNDMFMNPEVTSETRE